MSHLVVIIMSHRHLEFSQNILPFAFHFTFIWHLAAYAYGFDNQRFDGYKILVFDFGGGTFDVSILNVQDNTFEQRAIAGDPELGGRDLDLILRDYCAHEIKERWGRDCLVSKMIAQTLLEKCEEIKITLSSAEEARFENAILNWI